MQSAVCGYQCILYCVLCSIFVTKNKLLEENAEKVGLLGKEGPFFTTCACETNRAINIIIIYDCIILYFHSVALFTDYYLNYGIASLFAAIGIYSAAMLGAITIWAVVSLSKLLIESSMLRP